MWTLGPAWRDEAALSRAWHSAVPFPHLVIDDFVADGPLMELLDEEGVERQEGDIFAFEASRDLDELSAAFGAALCAPLARITGKPLARAALRAYAYRPGHYLLPHTDHQDGLPRLVAFAYYLPAPEPPTGGELELFRVAPDRVDSAVVIAPVPWRLALFDCSDTSLHQVREVLSGLRLSLAGWFYP